VKYLLSKDEDAQFRKLKTDEERKAFIDQFWTLRDPSPGTPANEFKEIFTKRLTLVEQKFAAGAGRAGRTTAERPCSSSAPRTAWRCTRPPPPVALLRKDCEPSRLGGIRIRIVITGQARDLYLPATVLPGMGSPLKLDFVEESTGEFRLLGKFDFTDPRMTGLSPLPLPAAPARPSAPAAPAAPPAPSRSPSRHLLPLRSSR